MEDVGDLAVARKGSVAQYEHRLLTWWQAVVRGDERQQDRLRVSFRASVLGSGWRSAARGPGCSSVDCGVID